MEIRAAELSDIETVVSFNVRLAEESEGLSLNMERLRAGVSAVLRDESLGFYLLAESGGNALGQLAITYEWSDWRNGTFWWLQSVYVRSEYRRKGVLRALYDDILQRARQRGVCGVRLYVERHNVKAQQAYRRLGLNQAVFDMYENDFVICRDRQ